MTALKKEEEGMDGKICEECGNLNPRGRFTCAACGAKLKGGASAGETVKDKPKADAGKSKVEVEPEKEKVKKAVKNVKRGRKPGTRKTSTQTRHNVRFKKQIVLVASCSCGWAKNFGPDKTATELAEAIETHKK